MGGSRGDLRVAGQMCVAWHARVRLSSTWPEQPQALGWVVTHWHSYQTRLIGLCLCMSVQHIWSTRVSMQMHNLLLPFMHVGVLVLPFTHICLFFFQSLSFAGRSCQGFCFFVVVFLNANLLATRSCTLATAWPSFSPHVSAVMMLRGCNTHKNTKRFGNQARAPARARLPCWNTLRGIDKRRPNC